MLKPVLLIAAISLVAASCKDPETPANAASSCNVMGTWRLRVVWEKGNCDLLTEGEGMRLWVSKGWDGSIEVRKGSKLGDSAIEAVLVEAKDCNFIVHANSEGREDVPSTVVLTMKQAGETAKGTASYERKGGTCRQQGTVEAEKM